MYDIFSGHDSCIFSHCVVQFFRCMIVKACQVTCTNCIILCMLINLCMLFVTVIHTLYIVYMQINLCMLFVTVCWIFRWQNKFSVRVSVSVSASVGVGVGVGVGVRFCMLLTVASQLYLCVILISVWSSWILCTS